jgi:hypothetical protein
MDMWVVLLLILIGVFVLALLIAGLVFLILAIARTFGGIKGGWGRLAEAYSTPISPGGEVVKRQTLQIGAVVYKRCVTLGITDEGLYVSIWRKTILIPWHDFKRLGQATLYWQKVPMLTIGEPPVATITLPVSFFEMMRSRLPGELVDAK